MKRFTYLLLLLSPLLVFAQNRLDLVHENAFAFYDYQEKAFCALDDSTFIWKYIAKKMQWIKSFDVQDKKHSMSNVTSGVYFLEVSDEKRSYIVTVIKE